MEGEVVKLAAPSLPPSFSSNAIKTLLLSPFSSSELFQFVLLGKRGFPFFYPQRERFLNTENDGFFVLQPEGIYGNVGG